MPTRATYLALVFSGLVCLFVGAGRADARINPTPCPSPVREWVTGIQAGVSADDSSKIGAAINRRKAVGRRIVRAALADVGAQERTGRNDHPLFNYYRKLGKVGNRRTKRGKYLPYCAVAVNAWHRQAGVFPKPVGGVGRARHWGNHPSRLSLGPRTGPQTVARLDTGMAIGFHFGPGRDHVGIIETPYPLYAVTIEGNTSLSGSIGHYRTRHDGVIHKIRWYKAAAWAADWRDSPDSDTLDVVKLRRHYIPKPKPFLLP